MATPGQIPLFGNPNEVITTVASNRLLQLAIGKNLSVGPLDPNIRWILYVRSLKVFRMSFAGYDQIAPDRYNEKYTEYRYNMGQLYNIDINDPSLANIDPTITGHLESEEYITKISILRLRTPAPIPYIEVEIVENYSETNQKTDTVLLNPYSEEQHIPTFKTNHTYQSYVERRLDNTRGIILTVRTPDIQFDTINIQFRHISAYGFRDWIQFSQEVELFVEIEVNGFIEEQGAIDEFIYFFHIQTLYEMLNKLLNDWRTNLQLLGLPFITEHRDDRQKFDTTINRSLVDPNSEAAFWSTTTVEVWDLQTVYLSHNIAIDSVCLCDRWCNWTAFFYYSPIYRFLLLCHKQLYLDNKTHIPEMYVMVSAFCTTLRGQRLAQTDQLPPTPVYRLLNNAIDYKKQYSLLLISKQLNKNLYRFAIPQPKDMLGLAYNILRFEADWVAQVHQLYGNHFTHECVDTFCQLALAFTEIHGLVGEVDDYIDIQTQRKRWRIEFKQIVRNHCYKYVSLGGLHINQQQIMGIDWLFGEDFKHSKRLPKTPNEEKVWTYRAMVLSYDGPDRNPLMICAQLSPLLNTFYSVYLFNGMTESLVTKKPESNIEAMIGIQQCRYLDQLFTNYMVSVPPVWPTYQLSGQQLMANGIQHMQHQLMVVYMLRVYHMAYEWQNRAINVLEEYNDYNLPNERVEPCLGYEKLFNIDYLEHHYRDVHHNQLFTLDVYQLDTNFYAFYGNYWPRPTHETNPQLTINQVEQSVIQEYNKLYHWWIYQGDGRIKFVRLINWIADSIDNVRQSGRQIFDNHLLPAIFELSAAAYEYSVDVLDYLVYYLVKAQCFAIVCIVNKFLSKLISLQSYTIYQYYRQFSLCKPGWVPMFRTIDTVWAKLDSLLADSIIYDDECQRISGTVEETKQLTKHQYRQYYDKIGSQWIYEIRLLRQSQHTLNTTTLIRLHLAVGVGFVAAFTNTFRRVSRRLWQRLVNLFDEPIDPQKPQQIAFRNRRPHCLQYLQNIDTVLLESVPLIREPWIQELAHVLNIFANNDIQQLGINLDQSNY